MPGSIVACCAEHRLSFKNMNEMHIHMKEYHYDLYCKECGRNFVNKKSKEMHTKYTHKNHRHNQRI